MKNDRITDEQLLSSGVLDEFLNHSKNTPKGKNYWMPIKDRVAIITHNMNYLIRERKEKKFDPARRYLKKLKNDITRLSCMETHLPIFNQIRHFFDIEIKVGIEYCNKFRPLTKDFNMNLFIFVLYTKTFKDLSVPKRLEIISDIYLLICNTPKDFKGWKKSDEAYYDEKAIETIEKRIQRVPGYFKIYLNSEEYKEFEERRIVMLKEHISNGTFSPMNDRDLKLYIRDSDLVKKIEQRIKEKKNRFNGMNILELPEILNSLELNDSDGKICNELIADTDFIRAFQTPPVK